jgi:hypothetical protein
MPEPCKTFRELLAERYDMREPRLFECFAFRDRVYQIKAAQVYQNGETIEIRTEAADITCMATSAEEAKGHA